MRAGRQRRALLGLVAAAGLALAGRAAAHGTRSGPNLDPVETPWGRTGDPKRVDRTITIDMGDDMRFRPAALSVRQGETLRLFVRNRGRLLHELVIGTDEELRRHAELMRRFPNMEHDDPYLAHVDPGKRGEIVWQFTQPGEFKFACLVPGHFEAGMIGTITVRPR